jgi:hypothetical protein
MAYVDITAQQHVTYGTSSHGEETLVQPGGEYPSQLKWSDLHPPGVKVLPKGSPPAGPGEINWEDTLGGRFAKALQRLEGLLYAVFGSRPAAYNMGGVWRKCHWWDRLHPRCLWGPEIWKPRIIIGPEGCTEVGQCWDYAVSEYAALGNSPYGYPTPSVPIRTRSGDPKGQFQTGVHDRTYFPVGSVERDFQDEYPYDPEGRGWFGATNPGRDDAASNPWLDEANGYTWKDGDGVTFTWTKPDGIQTPNYVRLYYRTKPPGGTWSGWSNVVMTGGPPTYTATRGPYQHGTEMQWYVRIQRLGIPGVDPGYIKYDPGGNSAPAAADAYFLAWYTHFNPYGNGLPEMLDDYGGVDVRHGTDFFEFDGSETVQPGLINLVRWTISALCGMTCHYDDVGCDEGYEHPGRLHHSPRIRGGGHPYCCIPWPIRFYWSGSNVHPHYRRRGKGDQDDWNPLDTRPLKNLDGEPNYGLQTARKSWRGIDNLYRDDPMDNPYYGGGVSWGVPPFELQLWYEPAWDYEARIYATFQNIGLREGDVIDPVHVEECIDAINYLIDYGVWTIDPIKTCKKQPDSYLGRPCGLTYHYWASGPNHDPGPPWPCADEVYGKHYLYESNRYYPCRGGCCGPTSECPSPNDYYVYDDTWQTHEGGYHVTHHESGTYNPGGQHCDDFATPSWEDCWNQAGDCTPGKCRMVANKAKGCTNWPYESDCHSTEVWECVGCDANATGPNCEVPPIGCGFYKCGRSCYWWDSWCGEWYHCTETNCEGWQSPGIPCSAGYSVGSSGLSYHFCTGPQCRPGWDDDHGGGYKKNRLDHVWHTSGFGGLWSKATGPPGHEFSGNCFGDIYVCGDLSMGTHPNVWFHDQRSVYWEGIASVWYTNQCDCTSESHGGCPSVPYSSDPPPIPGFGLHDLEGDPLCSEDYHKRYGGSQAGRDGMTCYCNLGDFEPCSGDAAWVAVDLNLDGTGRPYRHYAGLDGQQEPYTGDGIPRLRDYDMTKDPETWMHDCPCETWTGAGVCVV